MKNLYPKFLSLLFVLLNCMFVFAQSNWSDGTTWPNGEIPEPDQEVMIPHGKTVILDVTTPILARLTIHGKLIFKDSPGVALSTHGIMVMGQGALLQIGTKDSPYVNKTSITLYGKRSSGTEPINKGLMAMNGGSLIMHGIRKNSTDWSALTKGLLPGDTVMEVENAEAWQVGDELVIAPSGYDPREAEKVTITSISGTQIAFEPSVTFMHYGEKETYEGKTIDMRAEVGLLTRNILIKGDDSSIEKYQDENYTIGFGGHIMVMNNAGPTEVAGVELYRMGQTQVAARYPFHWHLAGDRTNDFFSHNSIHDSFHRAVVTHGTHNALVSDNVAYNAVSHMYVVSEDGDETGNQYYRNLGILCWRVSRDEEAFDTDDNAGTDNTQQEHRPGVFWLKNWDNTLINNHAAGAFHGMGFFYDNTPTGADRNVVFSGNLAHSSFSNTNGNIHYPPNTKGHGLFVRRTSQNTQEEWSDFSAYKNSISGAWLEETNQFLKNTILAANGIGFFVQRGHLEDAVIIGETGNTNGTISNPGPNKRGAITVLGHQGLRKEMTAKDVTIIDFPNAAIVWEGFHVTPNSWSEEIKIINTQPFLFGFTAIYGPFKDRDGSITGTGECQFLFPLDREIEKLENATLMDEWSAFYVPCEDFIWVELNSYISETDTWGGDLILRTLDGDANTLGVSLDNRRNNVKHGFLPKNVSYQVLPGVTTPEKFQIEVNQGGMEDFVLLEFPYSSSNYRVFWEGETDLIAVDNYAELVSNTATTHYYDKEEQKLFIKVFNNDTQLLNVQNLNPRPQEEIDITDVNNTDTDAVESNNNDISLFDFLIYPNPSSSGVLNVSITSPNEELIEFSIFDILGRLIQTKTVELQKGASTVKLETINAASGSYILQLNSLRGVGSKKFIIE